MTATEVKEIRMERAERRIRAYLKGKVVADTVRPMLVWEHPDYPTYFFPAEDVRGDLISTGRKETSPLLGEASVLTAHVRDHGIEGAALRFDTSPIVELRDLVRFEWAQMDAWFEEDEEVYTHARDPYTRVDILHSSRQVMVEIDGVTLAETMRPRMVFESGMPIRVFMPKTDVHMELIEPSDTITHSPYLGAATHWNVRVGEKVHHDLAYTYRTPLAGCEKIAGLVSFYDDKAELYLDGVQHERPQPSG